MTNIFDHIWLAILTFKQMTGADPDTLYLGYAEYEQAAMFIGQGLSQPLDHVRATAHLKSTTTQMLGCDVFAVEEATHLVATKRKFGK